VAGACECGNEPSDSIKRRENEGIPKNNLTTAQTRPKQFVTYNTLWYDLKNLLLNWVRLDICVLDGGGCLEIPINLHVIGWAHTTVKATPLQAWTGPEVSRRLRLPDFKTAGT
jgi:hypothetical protein